MRLSADSVQEFIEIYQKEFGEILSYKEAEGLADDLLSFYQLIIPFNN